MEKLELDLMIKQENQPTDRLDWSLLSELHSMKKNSTYFLDFNLILFL